MKLKEDDILEKRRRAPGWLDRDEKILEPEKKINVSKTHSEAPFTATQDSGIMQTNDSIMNQRPNEQDQAGEELDRVFGGLGIR